MATTQDKNQRRALWKKHLPELFSTTKNNSKTLFGDPQLELLMDTAELLELEPMLQEIVPHRGKPYITEMGLMKKATTSGQLDGLDIDASYEDPDGRGDRWIAHITLWRKDASHPFTLDTDEREYTNPDSGIWGKNRRSMTEKCGVCRVIRHAFAISLVSIEEMAVDERSGLSAEEARAALAVTEKTADGEAQAQVAAEAKAAQNEAAKVAAAEGQTQEQFKEMGRLLISLAWPRPEAFTFLHTQFPKLNPKEYEASLTRAEATAYIAILRRQLTVHLTKLAGLDTKGLREFATANAEGIEFEKLPVEGYSVPLMQDEQWPGFLRELRWATVDAIHAKLGRTREQADKVITDHFEGQRDRTAIEDPAVDAYIRELLTTTQTTPAAPSEPAEANQNSPATDGGENAPAAQQGSLLPT